MSLEVWVFGDRERFQRTGGLAEIRTVPTGYSLQEANDFARGIVIEYVSRGTEVRTMVRPDSRP